MFTYMVTLGQEARASVIRVFDIIDSRPAITDKPDAIELPPDAAGLSFDDVRFGYRPSEPVLRGLSLRVEPGETVAVVGASGSGKSTLALLLPRFYDPQAGSVRIGGHDVADVTRDSLRAAIGLVMEDSFLFSDTIRANIAYGRPDATDEQVIAVARAAQAHEFIARLPQGYDTVVGEQGLTLSGGQRQRVALARALITDPRVLLLDDATSAIDPRLEAEIHAALRAVMRGRTTLIIAHRRSTLNLADRIVVLDSGRVADTGTHAELEERCPLYRRLIVSGEYDDEAVRTVEDVLDDRAMAWPRRWRRAPGCTRRRAAATGGRERRARDRGAHQPAALPRAARPGRRAAAGERPAGRGPGRGAGRRPALHAAQAAATAHRRADHRAGPGRPGRAGRAGAARAGQERHRPRGGDQGLPRDPAGLARRAGHRAGRLAGQLGRDDGRRAERGAAAVHPAGQAVRPAPAPRPGLLRTRDVRPDHDQDDHRRGRAVHVPADRAGHHGQLGAHLLRRARRPAHHRPAARPGGAVHLAGAGGGHAVVPVQVGARLRRIAGTRRHGQRLLRGERGRPAGDAGVPPRAGQPEPVRRAEPGVPGDPAARPAVHRDLLPVRADPVHGRGRRRAGARDQPDEQRRADRGRADRLPALHRHGVRPRPAAVPGLRRLPAGHGGTAPDHRPAAAGHLHAAAPAAGHRGPAGRPDRAARRGLQLFRRRAATRCPGSAWPSSLARPSPWSARPARASPRW